MVVADFVIGIGLVKVFGEGDFAHFLSQIAILIDFVLVFFARPLFFAAEGNVLHGVDRRVLGGVVEVGKNFLSFILRALRILLASGALNWMDYLFVDQLLFWLHFLSFKI